MTATAERESEDAPPRAAARPPVGAAVAVAIVVAIGVYLRFKIKSDLWLDEALAVNIAHLPVRQIAPWLRHDGAPPLYYFLLHYWMKAFGTGDLGARSLSGVFGVVSLPLAWCCGRRIGGRATAWTAVLVLAASPFAIEYSTSARMYSMEICLVFAGILLVRRAFDQPSIERVAPIAVLTAVLVYTQYWALYLTIAVALFLLATIRRSERHRAAATRIFAAVAVGGATFLAWVPTFLYQAKHTGTPWGTPLLPPTPIGLSFQDFSGGNQHEGWMLLFPLIILVFIGVFGAATDSMHIDIDLHTRPDARWEALVGAATLVIGTSAAFVGRSAFQSRYAAIMFPFFVLVVAHGITRFSDPHVRTWVLVVVVGLGFAGGLRNSSTNRTEAGQVAAILRAEAKPGDVVLYCPDQLGPAVHRLVQPGLDEVTYPVFRRPGLVNWVDYKAVIQKHKVPAFAKQVLARAAGHTLWYVEAPGYRTHSQICDPLAVQLGKSRKQFVRLPSNASFYERPGLQEFPAR